MTPMSLYLNLLPSRTLVTLNKIFAKLWVMYPHDLLTTLGTKSSQTQEIILTILGDTNILFT
jgi:hypothetical protein